MLRSVTPKRKVADVRVQTRTYLEAYWERGRRADGDELDDLFSKPRQRPLQRLWEVIRKTLAGETTTGIILGEIKNFILPWLPHSRAIDALADKLGDQFKSEGETDMEKVKKWLKQPSTKAAIVLLAAVAGFFGVEIAPDMLGDAINQIVQGIAAVIGGITILVEAFRNEPEKPEQ